jgi:hypothetical protein
MRATRKTSATTPGRPSTKDERPRTLACWKRLEPQDPIWVPRLQTHLGGLGFLAPIVYDDTQLSSWSGDDRR